MTKLRLALALAALTMPSALVAKPLPPAVLRQIPRPYVVLASAEATNVAGRTFYFVVLAVRGEYHAFPAEHDSTPRPMLIFGRLSDGGVRLAGRNDDVVARATDGGMAANGCDPFEEKGIAVKGQYVTIENKVACGAHWTDFITFRFDAAIGGYVFDNSRFESWSLNPGNGREGDALVSDGQKVIRASSKIPFAQWRRPSDDR